MKRKWLITVCLGAVAVVVALGFSGCAARDQEANEAPEVVDNGSPVIVTNQTQGIWVSGIGEITVTPDVATLSVGVEATAETVAEAQTQASAGMDAIMTALGDGGVAASDIQTAYFNIRQRIRWDEAAMEEVITGYWVTNTVTAKVRDIGTVAEIIDSVVAAGGDLVRINNISFSVDEPETHYEQVRELAMADAEDKASQLSDLAGLTLGKPTYISEGSLSPVYQTMYYEMGGMAVSSTPTAPVPMPMPAIALPPISPGDINISLMVQVAYGVLD